MFADAEFLKLTREMLQVLRDDIIERQQKAQSPTSVMGELLRKRSTLETAVRQIQNSRQQGRMFGEEAERG